MLGHCRWDNYIRMQETGQLPNSIVDETVTLGKSMWPIMLGHFRREGYIKVQQMGELH